MYISIILLLAITLTMASKHNVAGAVDQGYSRIVKPSTDS
jgi:hypothetical protein